MDLLIIFLFGVVASFFSSFMSGGLGVISITGLLAFGLSPHIALGTFRLGGLGYSIGGFYQYVKAGKVLWKYVIPFSLISIVGAVLGAKLIIAIDESLLERIIGFAILLFIPFSIWKPTLGVYSSITSLKERVYGYISLFFASIWGGSITIGTGILVIYTLMYWFGMTILEARGSMRLPNFLKSIFVLLVFSYYDLINWELGLVFAVGMMVGSSVGTRYALKMGDSWLRYILLITIGLFSLKLILGL